MPYIKIRGPSPPEKVTKGGFDPPIKNKYCKAILPQCIVYRYKSGADPPMEGKVRICSPS